jgi:hypothetical protein
VLKLVEGLEVTTAEFATKAEANAREMNGSSTK